LLPKASEQLLGSKSFYSYIGFLLSALIPFHVFVFGRFY